MIGRKDVKEELHRVAVNLQKSRNMHISAGVMYAELWDYIASPNTDGAQQLADADYPINQYGLWMMLTDDPDFPAALIGKSGVQGRRLLAIGRSGNPEEADRMMREEKKAENAKRYSEIKDAVTKPILKERNCNNVPDAQFSSLEALKGAVKDLSADDFTAFKKWFREFCGA